LTGRTIIVGDVHGCRSELETLLDRIAFTSGDRLAFVGDVLARGPDSLGVLDIVRQTGAILVRGNHEQKLLDLRSPEKGASAHSPSSLHFALARSLRPVDWKLLQSSPVRVVFREHDLCLVHAGIVPGIALDHQDEQAMMRIRTVATTHGRGQHGEEQVLWGSRWVGPPHIVFGHNAAPGLQLHPWATGLDTGCVYGGRLTALVLGANRKVPRDVADRRALLVSVPAERIWYAPDKRRAS
jgi:hypothetical protein